MITLTFQPAQRIDEHFKVSPDHTMWQRQYVKTKHGLTPDRLRATYRTIQGILEPVTDTARSLDHATGLYLLAFDIPEPALYIGIAAEAKTPEGILRRLRKHCIKAMGSNVGSATSTGGVHHPRQWCDFAIQRHEHTHGTLDELSDVRFASAQASDGNHKDVLQKFEHLICTNTEGVLDGICHQLWPGRHAQDVRLLTRGMVKLKGEFDYRIRLY